MIVLGRNAARSFAVAFSVVIVAACASAVRLPRDWEAAELVWPAPPSEPRLAFVRSFSGAEDLGIRKRFLSRLRVLMSGSSPERLVRPMAVVRGAGDRYYIADPGVGGVHLFDLERGDYRLIQGENGEPLPSPVGLAAGPGGEVFVTDSRLSGVFIIEAGASEARRMVLDAPLSQPTGIAVDWAGGRIFVVDTDRHQIRAFSRDGELLQRIGGRGTTPGKFNFPTMISITESGDLLVSDSLNFRIQAFDRKGAHLHEFGGTGDRAGYLPQPKGIAVDSHGHVYIVDSVLHSVQIFDRAGAFLYQLGVRGAEPGEFWLPAGIFIDERDTIFIADAYNARVQVFRYVGGGLR